MQHSVGSPYYFCTYFDRNYLYKGLALYRSLVRHCGSFVLWVLCLDRDTHAVLSKMNLPQVRLITLEEFERGDDALVIAKKNRSAVEYYCTCTPSLFLYVLEQNPKVDVAMYLDADLFFFSDLQPIYVEMDEQSILIVDHRFAPGYTHRAALHGTYNVGVVGIRRDGSGLACLRWWRERCLEWCYWRVEDGKFGDQKYLDDWLTRFGGVVVLQHQGAGLAPWNISNYHSRLTKVNGRVLVDSFPLIFYHFHSLRIFAPFLFEMLGDDYVLTRQQVEYIYKPYAQELGSVMRVIKHVDRRFQYGYSAYGLQTLNRLRKSGRLLFVPPVLRS